MYSINHFRCEGKIAIVTGGAGLYGWAVTEALAEAGALVVVASRSRDEYSKKRPSLPEDAAVYHYTLDLTSEASIDSLVSKVAADFGGIDILINNVR